MNEGQAYYNMEGLGNRITELRKATGMSQTQLACILNTSLKHLNQIEHGKKGISIDLLLIISNYFNISTDYLLKGVPAAEFVCEELYQSASDTLAAAANMHRLISSQMAIQMAIKSNEVKL